MREESIYVIQDRETGGFLSSTWTDSTTTVEDVTRAKKWVTLGPARSRLTRMRRNRHSRDQSYRDRVERLQIMKVLRVYHVICSVPHEG